jgi:hypothetical protein
MSGRGRGVWGIASAVSTKLVGPSNLGQTVAPGNFGAWARRWIDLASYPGTRLLDEEARIAELDELWQLPIPSGWERPRVNDVIPLDRAIRCRRSHRGGDLGRRDEHTLEDEVLDPSPDTVATTCFGLRLVDGVNAVPLATDSAGGRAGNVEADMVLLVGRDREVRLLLIEVKVVSNNAWYAAVENLRQLKLFLHSASPRDVFHHRLPELSLPDDLHTTAVVLAPRDFYTAAGAKSAAVGPATRLLQRMSGVHDEADAVLATWDPASRAIERFTAAD